MRLTTIIFSLLLFSLTLNAQKKRSNDYQSANYRDFSNKPFFFGLTLGYNQTNYKIFRSGYFLTSDSIIGINSAKGQGFIVSVISNLKIG